MAKTKSKKNSTLGQILGIFGSILGIAAVFMGFLNFVTLTGKLLGATSELGTLTGIQAAFGAKAAAGDKPSWAIFADGTTSNGEITLASKTGVLILFILLLAGALVLLLGSLMKGKIGKFLMLVGGAAMIAGAIMAFCAISLCAFESKGSGTAGYEYSLGIGAILAGVLGGVGGLAGLGSGIVGLLK